jgi:hypothetical protein
MRLNAGPRQPAAARRSSGAAARGRREQLCDPIGRERRRDKPGHWNSRVAEQQLQRRCPEHKLGEAAPGGVEFFIRQKTDSSKCQRQ